MALAILRLQDSDRNFNRFKIDIGDNRFYSYAIGRGRYQDSNKLEQLEMSTFTSPLKPISEISLGRTVLEVPSHYFDRNNRFIQLTSYRTQERIGPAISEVVEVFPALPSDRQLPVMSFSQENTMSPTPTLEPLKKPDTVPFQYVEAQSHYSEGMFLGSLVSAISGVASTLLPMVTKALPVVGNVVGSLLGGSSGGGNLLGGIGNVLGGLLGGNTSGTNASTNGAEQNNAAASSQATLGKLLTNPETLNRLSDLLQQKANNSSGEISTTKQALATLLQQLAKITQQTQNTNGKAEALSFEEYSEQQGILDFFKGMTGKIAGGIKDVGKFVLDNAPAIIEFIAANPELLAVALSDDFQVAAPSSKTLPHRELEQVTTKYVTGLSAPTSVPDYQRVDSVQLRFTGISPQIMHGRSIAVYRQDRDIVFPLTLETPRSITKGVLYLLVTHATTLKVLLEQKYRVENVASGKLPVMPRLSATQLQALTPNEDYIVSVALVWTATSKQTGEKRLVGTNQTQRMTLIGEYCFDRVEESSQVIPLNDVEKHRPYWHKVWQGDFTNDLKRITWDCKYYYALETNRDNNARMETVTTVDDEDFTRRSGRLKTGLILSPYQLNELLRLISPNPPLEEGELKALMSPEFKDRFSCVAQTQVRFEGNRGDSVAVWVYPEVKLQQVVLKKAEQTDENGQVLKLSERSVSVPIPAVAHFIGVAQ